MTARCGIVLHPAGHTLSPVIHRAAYRELGLDAEFQAHDVPPEALAERIRALRDEGVTQLCVSLPHKEAVLALADQVSMDSRKIGAANTLTARDGALVADNTDWIGVTSTVEPLGDWRGRRATVLGAGGAARAVVYALLSLDMTVTVVNRTRSRAVRLIEEVGGGIGTLDDPYDLLVNATSIGLAPEVDATPADARFLRAGSTVFDTVYRPLETRLLREAREAGCRVQDGLDMLVHQAVEQIRLWSGKRADAALLRRVALEELARR